MAHHCQCQEPKSSALTVKVLQELTTGSPPSVPHCEPCHSSKMERRVSSSSEDPLIMPSLCRKAASLLLTHPPRPAKTLLLQKDLSLVKSIKKPKE